MNLFPEAHFPRAFFLSKVIIFKTSFLQKHSGEHLRVITIPLFSQTTSCSLQLDITCHCRKQLHHVTRQKMHITSGARTKGRFGGREPGERSHLPNVVPHEAAVGVCEAQKALKLVPDRRVLATLLRPVLWRGSFSTRPLLCDEAQETYRGHVRVAFPLKRSTSSAYTNTN